MPFFMGERTPVTHVFQAIHGDDSSYKTQGDYSPVADAHLFHAICRGWPFIGMK